MVTINEIEYDFEALAGELKNQIANIRFKDKLIARLRGQFALVETARVGYLSALRTVLDQDITDA